MELRSVSHYRHKYLNLITVSLKLMGREGEKKREGGNHGGGWIWHADLTNSLAWTMLSRKLWVVAWEWDRIDMGMEYWPWMWGSHSKLLGSFASACCNNCTAPPMKLPPKKSSLFKRNYYNISSSVYVLLAYLSLRGSEFDQLLFLQFTIRGKVSQ